MGEHRRRMRPDAQGQENRAQDTPAQETPVWEAPAQQEHAQETPHRRRRQAAHTEPPEQPQARQHAQTHKAAPHRSQTQKSAPQKAGARKPALHKPSDATVRAIREALLGAALVVGLLGQAIVHAVRYIGRCLRKLSARQLTALLLVIVAAVSAYQVGSILWRTVRTTRLNDELAERRAELMTAEEQEPAFAVYEMQAGEEPEESIPEQSIEQEPVEQETALQEIVPQETASAATAEPAQEAAASSAPAATAAPNVVTSTKYHQVGGDALPEMAALYEENRDLIAWIEIPDVLDLPVVYKDNKYYLTHDFNKQKNTSGTIFLDVNHPFKEKTQNLLLHGHNMKDGTMFGRLAQYLHDGTYIKNHPFINFSTLWKKEQYVIFAVLNVSLDVKSERFFNYFTHNTFSSDAEFSSYIRQLQLRSSYAIPIDVQPTDALLTLSTCLDDDRLVIVARRLRQGETRSELRQIVYTATRQ